MPGIAQTDSTTDTQTFVFINHAAEIRFYVLVALILIVLVWWIGLVVTGPKEEGQN